VGCRGETAVGSWMRRGRQWGAGRDGGRILGASREAVGSRGETTAGSWVRRGRQWGAGARRRRRCWGETNLIRIIIDIFSTILCIN
jgi:hypothetical protein